MKCYERKLGFDRSIFWMGTKEKEKRRVEDSVREAERVKDGEEEEEEI